MLWWEETKLDQSKHTYIWGGAWGGQHVFVVLGAVECPLAVLRAPLVLVNFPTALLVESWEHLCDKSSSTDVT
jgi:hypothetical protein